MTLPIIVLTLIVAVVAWLLTAAVRRYALEREILDIPNDRSSHAEPTPRGGGLAIVIAVLGGISMAWLLGWISDEVCFALVGGGLLIAAVGWLDDHRPLPALRRLLVHFVAAGWAVYWLGSLPALRFGSVNIPLGIAGLLLALLTIVWTLNFYNFMDGIDGIAATEALTVAGGALLLAVVAGSIQIAVICLIIAAASFGFLLWNWHPARIFMGDVGSGFLGYILAVTALASERTGGPPLELWGVLLGVFIVDATVTLARRAMRGELLSAAHRSHAYQRAVLSGASHAQVTSAVAAINLILISLALLAQRTERLTLAVVLIALAMLGLVYRGVERRRPMKATRTTSAAGD